jgi:hypothetical protein
MEGQPPAPNGGRGRGQGRGRGRGGRGRGAAVVAVPPLPLAAAGLAPGEQPAPAAQAARGGPRGRGRGRGGRGAAAVVAVAPAAVPPANVGINAGRGGPRGRGRGRGGRGAAAAAGQPIPPPAAAAARDMPAILARAPPAGGQITDMQKYDFTSFVILYAKHKGAAGAAMLDAVLAARPDAFDLNVNPGVGFRTPFYIVFTPTMTRPVMQWLLDHGANLAVTGAANTENLYHKLAQEEGQLTTFKPLWDALVAAGVNPNLYSHTLGIPLKQAIIRRNRGALKRLLEVPGIDKDWTRGAELTPLMLALKEGAALGDFTEADMLSSKGAQVSKQNDVGGIYHNLESANAFWWAGLHGVNPDIPNADGDPPIFTIYRKRLENWLGLFDVLIGGNATVNVRNRVGQTLPMLVALEGHPDRTFDIELLEFLLDRHIDGIERYDDVPVPVSPINPVYHGRTLLQIAQDAASPMNAEVRAIILRILGGGAAPPAAPAAAAAGPPWEGWTFDEAQKFNAVLNTQTEQQYTCCPICLKYVERSAGCLYMHHNCSKLRGYFHRQLYDLFKHVEADGMKGEIEWCTSCGRICYNHAHYKLKFEDGQPATVGEILRRGKGLQLHESGGYYDTDCAATNHGGGIREKIARVRALRAAALSAQALVGVAPEEEVQEMLLITNWNAPLVGGTGPLIDRIRATRSWNIPSHLFPSRGAADVLDVVGRAVARLALESGAAAAGGGAGGGGAGVGAVPEALQGPLIAAFTQAGRAAAAIAAEQGRDEIAAAAEGAWRAATGARVVGAEGEMLPLGAVAAPPPPPPPGGAGAAAVAEEAAPPPAPPPPAAAAEPILRPIADDDLNPEVLQGHSTFNLNDPDTDPPRPILQFRHLDADGNLNEHEGATISVESFVAWLRDITENRFGTPEFGLCWNHPHCTARLWPEELESLVAQGVEEITPELLEEYRQKFYERFRGQGGGARSKRRRSPQRKQKGGARYPLFVNVTAESACVLPSRESQGKGGARRHRRTRRVLKLRRRRSAGLSKRR